MMREQHYAPPTADLEMQREVKLDGPVGLGGWLILVAIGLIIGPIRVGYWLATSYWPIFTDGTWQQLTDVASPAYHVYWAPVLVFEVVGNLILILLSVTTLIFFLRKSRRTPPLAISLYAFSAAFVTADFYVCDLIPTLAEQADAESSREALRSWMAALIWIPYFLVSKRVRNTFVH